MSITVEKTAVNIPTTYQEWLTCFEIMKSGSVAGNEAFDAASNGSFVGNDLTKNALQRQIVETVNAVLDKSVKRFIRNLNESIAFNELPETVLLFKRLKKDVHKALFFTKLSFLPKDLRQELEKSVKDQMTGFWEDTITFLQNQSLEFSNSDLEDVLFLVKRIRLF